MSAVYLFFVTSLYSWRRSIAALAFSVYFILSANRYASLSEKLLLGAAYLRHCGS